MTLASDESPRPVVSCVAADAGCWGEAGGAVGSDATGGVGSEATGGVNGAAASSAAGGLRVELEGADRAGGDVVPDRELETGTDRSVSDFGPVVS